MATSLKQPAAPRARSHEGASSSSSAHLRPANKALSSAQRRVLQDVALLHDDLDGPSTSGRGSALPSVLREMQLQQALRSKQQAVQQDLSRMDVVASRMLALSAALDVDVSAVARLVGDAEGVDLLLLPPLEVKARLQAVAQVRGASHEGRHLLL